MNFRRATAIKATGRGWPLLLVPWWKAMRTVTLNQNYQFRRLYRRQPAGVSPVLVTYAATNRLAFSRIGILLCNVVPIPKMKEEWLVANDYTNK